MKKSAKSYLRKEVAAEISRRRLPDVTFRVIVDPDYFLGNLTGRETYG